MFGKYKHSVDEKGRLFVPSKLRDELGSTFYVTPVSYTHLTLPTN